jgi:hypothetical protein
VDILTEERFSALAERMYEIDSPIPLTTAWLPPIAKADVKMGGSKRLLMAKWETANNGKR